MSIQVQDQIVQAFLASAPSSDGSPQQDRPILSLESIGQGDPTITVLPPVTNPAISLLQRFT